MSIQVNLGSLKTTKPHEYAIRFLFGGLVTAATGLIAKLYGPVVAGLFLAFPAIFPATATLIAKHEKERKRKAGYDGTRRGRAAAAADAAGTSLSAIALIAFALIVWRLLPRSTPWLILPLAASAWAVAAVILWHLRRKL
jgi:MFS family permease